MLKATTSLSFYVSKLFWVELCSEWGALYAGEANVRRVEQIYGKDKIYC